MHPHSIPLLRPAVAALLLVSVAGCSTSNNEKPNSRDSASASDALEPSRSVCGGLFGSAGGSALKKLSGDTLVHPYSGSDGAQLMKRTVADMRSRWGQEPGVADGHPRNVCIFQSPSRGDDKQHVELKYQWSKAPQKRKHIHFYYTAGSALVDLGMGGRMPTSSIYFVCRKNNGTSGVVKGQYGAGWHVSETDVRKVDRWSAQVLLATATKMSDALGCTNKPDIDPKGKITALDPDELPKKRPPLPELPESGPVRK